MQIKLNRLDCGKDATLGEFFVNGEHECWCVEDQDRNLERYPDAKIQGQTCIPRGMYKIIISYSNRFKRELPLLVDVPGFQGIRIHPGNTNADTEGCLLPCSSWKRDEKGGLFGVNSREAFRRLFEKIQSALDAYQDVTIEIL